MTYCFLLVVCRYLNRDAFDVDWKPGDKAGNRAFKISGRRAQRSSQLTLYNVADK